MPSAVAWPVGLATLIRNWTRTSMDQAPHNRHQEQRIATSIRNDPGCAFGSPQCAHSYQKDHGPIGGFAYSVSQVTLFVATVSHSAHQFALSEQSAPEAGQPSGRAAGGGL
jgi:hypothetical protein